MTSLDAGGIATSGGVRFLGQRRSYWRLLIRGAVLLMVTLGIYRFWLATDVRRFLWSNTEIAGEALEYTGTALELLLGFLVAIALLIPVYAGFFLATLDLGMLGKLSGVVGFAALGVLGQYAIYRARRYRLTRTIYRGLRFHQEGSAWGFAFRAILWWIVTALTFGLAYPFQLASLERYKMRHTFYGDLGGRFEASAFVLLLRGFPMWLVLFVPLALAVSGFVGTVDWKALADALAQGGDDVMGKIEGGNPGLGGTIVFAMLMTGTSMALAALLYPAFQAVILRWWSSGLRFGKIEVQSHLRMRNVYGAYARFCRLCRAVQHRHGDCRHDRAGACRCSREHRKGRRRQPDRCNSSFGGGLCRHCTWLFNDLSRNRIAVALATGHGIAAIVRSFDARERKGDGTGKLRNWRGPRRCVERGKLLMAGTIEPPQTAMSGAGIYFDGVTSTRRDVVVVLAPAGLQISGGDGRALTTWSYDEIEGLAAPDNTLRLGRRGNAALERLEIRDPAFAAAIDARADNVDRSGSLATPPAAERHRLEPGCHSVVAGGRLVRRARNCNAGDAAVAERHRAQAGRCGEYAGAWDARHR